MTELMKNRLMCSGFSLIALLVLLHAHAADAAAVLYSQPAYQSPVRGEPDDLLLLPGSGFASGDVVVYQAITDTTPPLLTPKSIPNVSNATQGVAEVISYANTPHSLTIMLPRSLDIGKSYALWVVNTNNQWSNGIKINDARPLWISPPYAFQSAQVGALPRQLKVVGRNMQAAPSQVTQIKLSQATNSGQPPIILSAINDGDASTAIEHYAAQADLPPNLPPGDYIVQVSRDGVSWSTLSGQKFSVRPDPKPSTEFFVKNYGCQPNDGKDDVRCVKEAIKSASQDRAGGNVVFEPGVWNLISSAGLPYGAGIVVPLGVNLRGAGASNTTITRSAQWGSNIPPNSPNPTFSLMGQNQVEGFTFKDERIYTNNDWGSSMLQLGKIWYTIATDDSKVIRDVVISKNTFDKPFQAIVDGGLSIERLIVTNNEIGAFNIGLNIDGDANNLRDPFHLDDSVIAYNIFKPGSYMDVAIRQGTIASGIGASRRVDFSKNKADGTATRYFYKPATDPKGWRAAFFWHMRNNQEMVLVSQNQMSCTGDKTGDGEAVAIDNNHNSFGFDKAQTVRTATANSVRVRGPLQSKQNDKTLPAGYYNEHWVQIAEGPGVGQVRRVVSYTEDAGGVNITVTPAWNVIPEASSRLTMGLEIWQLYVVDNHVDHRKPPCLKSNRQDKPTTPTGGGVIGLWAQAADSSIEGNRQYDTSGILLHPAYSAVDPACPTCTSWTFLQYFLEVRNNLIDKEYDWHSDCSWSGIMTSYGASPTPGSPPPVTSYGVSIAGNTIIHADGFAGGAISFSPTWWDGPKPNQWKEVSNTLIYKNKIVDILGAAPVKKCAGSQIGRTGIELTAPTVSSTTLYSNDCETVSGVYLRDKGYLTKKAVKDGLANPCEK